MVSFTGSTRAGIEVAKAAADTVKRVPRNSAASRPTSCSTTPTSRRPSPGRAHCFSNSGQSCNAPTRMLVPQDAHDEAKCDRQAPSPTKRLKVGDPPTEGTTIGPVVSKAQYEKIQRLIQKGIDEGATWSPAAPAARGLEQGLLRAPTIFANVTQRHDHRARGDLRAGARRSCPTRTRPRRCASPTTRPTAWPATSVGRRSSARARRPRQMRAGNVHLNGAP
jgi:aldehyde dehydrogenase (NAD+)